jgi:flavin reductase (DIM6/NTAB) family NADH-FMN oxidoreductase RutF
MGDLVMAIDEAGFKKAMSRFACGVTVVTAEYEGKRYGATVSAFSSLSLTPPLVLICIGKNSTAHDAIRKGERFVVNILREGQEALSNLFASKTHDKFAGLETRAGKLGVPVLDGVLAAVECRLYETLPGGDHTIFVGEVVHADLAEGNPLVYFRGGYRELG